MDIKSTNFFKDLVLECKKNLGERLVSVYLTGSYAKGEETDFSDLEFYIFVTTNRHTPYKFMQELSSAYMLSKRKKLRFFVIPYGKVIKENKIPTYGLVDSIATLDFVLSSKKLYGKKITLSIPSVSEEDYRKFLLLQAQRYKMARVEKSSKLITSKEYLYLLSKILLKRSWAGEIYFKKKRLPLSYSLLSSLDPFYGYLSKIRNNPSKYLDEIPYLEALLEKFSSEAI
jgi:hypothetical protein